MNRLLWTLAAFGLIVGLIAPAAHGQLGGSRAGLQGGGQMAELPLLETKVAESFIVIEGRAEVRLEPTAIRIVMGVVGQGQTAEECQKTVDEKIARLKAAWAKLDVPAGQVVVDFISILPEYEWALQREAGNGQDQDAFVEKLTGYRMQSNVHVAVGSPAEADQVLDAAFKQGVTEIIAFDYHSDRLEEAKAQARKQALAAARGKAESLLGALLDDLPPVINLQERTQVYYPESLYESFTRSYEQEVRTPPRSNIPVVRAARPQNTYYRGLAGDVDVKPAELPMKPKISVVATIRVYYQSPAAQDRPDTPSETRSSETPRAERGGRSRETRRRLR
jgi:uncharacterized protein YggE